MGCLELIELCYCVWLAVAPPGMLSSEWPNFGREISTTASVSPAPAIEPLQQPQRERDLYLNLELNPLWSNTNSMWYRRETGPGKFEFWSVDLTQKIQALAFDHQQLADDLRSQGVDVAGPDNLGLDLLRLLPDQQGFEFMYANRFWRWSNASSKLEELADVPQDSDRWLSPMSVAETRRANRNGGPETHLVFVNRSDREVELFWSSGPNQRASYGKLKAGESRTQHTFSGHIWLVGEGDKTPNWGFQAQRQLGFVLIDNRLLDSTPPTNTPTRRPRQRERGGNQSPDGLWKFEVRDHNLWLIRNSDDHAVPLSTDGQADHAYNLMQWSPDSKTLLAFRVKSVERQLVHLIQSSPREGGRARLESRPYDLPGDPFPSYELNLFQVEGAKQIKPATDPIDFGWPDPQWSADGTTITYQQTDRGHQRFRIVEVSVVDGSVRNLVDQKTDTFIWTAHGDRPFVRALDSGDLIFGSEHEGYHHLYWVDRRQGKILHRITEGSFVVRSINRIDEEKRQIWFEASGVYADQDPYLIHFGRVNFDGTGLVFLTQSPGTHTMQMDPTGNYAVFTWSRVDHPPVHELRSLQDGQLIAELVRSQAATTERPPLPLPEVFSAPGRDGKTSIWGIICRPYPYDPKRKYPVIEDIYAGPHDHHVPKSFSPQPWYTEWTRLGFIVVKIDGMGTAHRSKAFHDVCWQNLKDAGFPDRILWHRAVAARDPAYDASRVGIFGTSAGGQNAAGAVIFHGDFYRAAAASCGCHDNRMDKASWNEQWMGYPVGPHYAASSNIDNAAKLQGKLLLLVGEMDTNVPPESTLRLVDALIKADRDFEFLLVPGLGHSDGGPYGRKKIREFFTKHLQPDRVEPHNSSSGNSSSGLPNE